MSWIKTISGICISTLILLELSSFLLTKANLFLFNDTPRLYRNSDNIPDIAYGRTEKELWGAWHVSNGTYRHTGDCFNVTMQFNEIGARDESISTLSDDSLMLIGDSFAEGFGVSYAHTSQFLIEERLGLNVANMGASGSFGPLQEWLIYREFNQLPHQGLVIFVLPANDFTDNDAKFWSQIDRTRYRPYFSDSDEPLSPFFFPEATKRDNFLSSNTGSLQQFIKDHFWLSNMLRTALYLTRPKADIQPADKIDIQPTDIVKSYYYDATETQQRNLLLAYDALLDAAKDKEALFVLIPSRNDIARYETDKETAYYRSQIWYMGLQNFTKRGSQKILVLDLMDYLPDNPDEIFFSCDDHWSPAGNKWAADTITGYILNEGLFGIQSTASN